MADEDKKIRLEIAAKGLEFSRSKAHDWQTKLMLLQAFATAMVGIAKTAGEPGSGASNTQLAELIPAIVIVTFAVAAAILFLANGHLRAAAYWAKEIDRLAGGTELSGYQRTLGAYYRGRWTKWLGIIPTIVISFVLLGAAILVTRTSFDSSNQVISLAALAVAFCAFVGNLYQSAYAEASR